MALPQAVTANATLSILSTDLPPAPSSQDTPSISSIDPPPAPSSQDTPTVISTDLPLAPSSQETPTILSTDLPLAPSSQEAPSILSTDFGLAPSSHAPARTDSPPLGLIPSQRQGGLIPSQRQGGLIPSQAPSGLIPSQAVPAPTPSSQQAPGLIPSQTPGLIPSNTGPGLIPSGPIPSGIIPSQTEQLPSPTASLVFPPLNGTNGTVTPMPSRISTDEGLKPIPAPTTAPGDPDGHHEIPEPDFSITGPCRGCSPVIEISATGFDEVPNIPTSPVADHAGPTTAFPDHAGPSNGVPQNGRPNNGSPNNGSPNNGSPNGSPNGNPNGRPNSPPNRPPKAPPKATITVGPPQAPSQVVISKAPNGPGFIVGPSTTVTLGQTVTIDHTPIVIRTSTGKTEVVVAGTAGTSTVPLTQAIPDAADPFFPEITAGPLLPPITIAGKEITANSVSQYVVSGQTLQPGGPAITVDGTTVSLLPSATAAVIDGVTSTLSKVYGALVTTTASPLLTLNNHVYTANRAGYYIIAPGTTLIPGGRAVTIFGTVVSLEPSGTAAIIQGSTSQMHPLTTVATLTRANNGYGIGDGDGGTSDGPGGLPQSTDTGKHSSAGIVRVSATVSVDGWLEGLFLLGMVGLGWLAVWL